MYINIVKIITPQKKEKEKKNPEIMKQGLPKDALEFVFCKISSAKHAIYP